MISKLITFIAPIAASAPEANIIESPGRNGVTTNPVSRNIIINNTAYIHIP